MAGYDNDEGVDIHELWDEIFQLKDTIRTLQDEMETILGRIQNLETKEPVE